jgi:fatty-acid desaturase
VQERFLLQQHKYYYLINLVYALVLYLVDPFAVVYAWLAPAAILWNAGSSIVSLSHREGSSHNDWILALLVWGEGYHTSHHQSPSRSRFGRFDVGGWLIEKILAPQDSNV